MPVPITAQKSTPSSAAHTYHTLSGSKHTQPLDLDIPTAEEIVDDNTLNIGDMEKRNILLALQRNHYKRKLAAEELGISERTLYRKIKAYGIDE